jgi:hypothetical protein
MISHRQENRFIIRQEHKRSSVIAKDDPFFRLLKQPERQFKPLEQ